MKPAHNEPKKQPRSFTRKVFHWRYCAKCWLVLLKNEPSQRRTKQPCDG